MNMNDLITAAGYISVVCTGVSGLSTLLSHMFPKASFFATLALCAGTLGLDLQRMTGGSPKVKE